MDDRTRKLAQLFLKFPGIGERQARRFAFFLLNQHHDYVHDLVAAMNAAREAVQECSKCFRLHEGKTALCSICSSNERDHSKLLIVEKQADLEAIEKTSYNGLFFILGGLVPIVEKKTLQKTRTGILKERLKNDAGIKEIILAFPLTPNGDHTDSFLREMIREAQLLVTTTSLGRGLSLGSELEYMDPRTLEISLKRRE